MKDRKEIRRGSEEWGLKSLRHLGRFRKGLSITKADLLDEGIPCLNYGEVHSRYPFEVNQDIQPLKCVDPIYNETNRGASVSSGDFVFADTSEDFEGVGNFTLVTGESPLFAGYHTIIYSLRSEVNPRFLAYSLDSLPFRTQLRLSVKGIKVFSITQEILRGARVLLPSIDQQRSIANLLDEETARIDTLIAKKTRFIELIKERIVALASQSPDSQSLQWVRLSHLCEMISRPVLQKVGNRYTKLGLLNRGRGVFKRDETNAEDMGDSEFFWVQPGDLILSGQFAWEGAVALADEEHTGCVVSHRFPIIRGVNNKVLTEYLYAYFMTSHGDFVLNDCSRGSAGRNRPLNMNLLLGWKIPVPSMKVQREIAMLVQLDKQIGSKVRKSIELLKEKRSALITAAVTGKIDVREAA